ncbi:hypothetical protein [Halostagnicola sp. A-GB9-2]|uniref:DUF7554 family protein n=1 Tax=Halostagnicola sp. A-GB9-2 TaxID=3048066 RepID=UPI0024C0C034|nr:hypothetical protein [Halostagnicola sp. A-GB9-2]MDJ1433003.1 hypothetical protein [Halostagnicola sp. A-GB9-2]
MIDTRGNIEVETLLKIVLGLLAIWLALSIVGTIISGLIPFLRLLIIAAIVLIVLWLLDLI